MKTWKEGLKLRTKNRLSKMAGMYVIFLNAAQVFDFGTSGVPSGAPSTNIYFEDVSNHVNQHVTVNQHHSISAGAFSIQLIPSTVFDSVQGGVQETQEVSVNVLKHMPNKRTISFT